MVYGKIKLKLEYSVDSVLLGLPAAVILGQRRPLFGEAVYSRLAITSGANKLHQVIDIFTLMGKIVSTKAVNKGAMENAFKNIWNQPVGFKVEEVGQNSFLLHFAKEKDMDKALENGPWIFRNRWMILTRWRRGLEGSNDLLTKVDIGVQIWGTPLHCRTAKVAEKLCSLLGAVKEVGLYEDQNSGNVFMKGLVEFDLKKPVRKGANLGNVKDGVFWVDFRYEKIPRCCYECGLFGHEESECVMKKPTMEIGKEFSSKGWAHG
ncbi:cysteine desulfurase mitochondrial-like [Senna tora]|uniref:Cysteine desulfurase mitochondrial-like n=1 Tax=Senna tora TaxID=362788 RepID=A0A834SNE1_9FABA|nr:cysteine desulfurase mitochondrial-like [Senna tora]